MKSLKIINVEQIGPHELLIEFSDKKKQAVDFGPFLNNSVHPEIRKYLEPRKFKHFKVIDGELMWGDFDLIFPLRDLYENCLERDAEVSRRRKRGS